MATDTRSTLAIQLRDRQRAWRLVGYLHNENERNWFESTEEYWYSEQRPVLGQVFEEHAPSWSPGARVSLPRWFSHLLPEGILRNSIAKSAHVSAKREFDMLAKIGQDDLPGAVRATPARRAIFATPEIEHDDDQGIEDAALKFSLDGVQLKFSVYETGKGLVVPVQGTAGNVILKFPDPRPGYDAVPEAELGGLELARSIGIDTPQAFLVEPRTVVGLERWAATTNGQALAVHRFDRSASDDRIHMEELAQIIDTSHKRKYSAASNEVIATVIAGLTGIESVAEVIDRLVLNIALGNGDAHLKNWAVLYPDSINPVLSPVYDLIPTILYMPDDDLGVNLAGTKEFSKLRADSFRKLGKRSNFGADDAEARALETWNAVTGNFSVLRDYFTISQYKALRDRLYSIPFTK